MNLTNTTTELMRIVIRSFKSSTSFTLMRKIFFSFKKEIDRFYDVMKTLKIRSILLLLSVWAVFFSLSFAVPVSHLPESKKNEKEKKKDLFAAALKLIITCCYEMFFLLSFLFVLVTSMKICLLSTFRRISCLFFFLLDFQSDDSKSIEFHLHGIVR